MESKYHRTEEGEEFVIEMGTTVYQACCDCGLVHKILTGSNVETEEYALVYFRDERRTAQLRRNNYGKLHNFHKKWKIVRK